MNVSSMYQFCSIAVRTWLPETALTQTVYRLKKQQASQEV